MVQSQRERVRKRHVEKAAEQSIESLTESVRER